MVFGEGCDITWPESKGEHSGGNVVDKLGGLRLGAETSSEVLQVQPRDKE